MGFFKDIVKSAGNFGQGVIDVARGAGGVVVDVAKGESTKESREKLGSGFTHSLNSYMNMAVSGQADKINEKTGGAYDKAYSANASLGNLIYGKSASQNIKDAASLALQGGSAYLGQNGVNIGGEDLTGFFQNILKGFDNKLNQTAGVSPNPANYYTPTSASYNGQTAQTNYVPYIVVGGIILVGAFMLLKKKK